MIVSSNTFLKMITSLSEDLKMMFNLQSFIREGLKNPQNFWV